MKIRSVDIFPVTIMHHISCKHMFYPDSDDEQWYLLFNCLNTVFVLCVQIRLELLSYRTEHKTKSLTYKKRIFIWSLTITTQPKKLKSSNTHMIFLGLMIKLLVFTRKQNHIEPYKTYDHKSFSFHLKRVPFHLTYSYG